MLSVLLIATNKYKQFVPDLVRQIDRYVLPEEEIGITIFADDVVYPQTSKRITVSFNKIPSYIFPQATLLRYHIFSRISEYLKKFSHLLYLDVDMGVLSDIGREVMVDGLLAVRHPGTYSTDRWGSPNNPKESTSWFPEENRKHYYCGGVQGGATEHYLEACKVLAARIEEDEKNHVMAEWHDETHWNKWCNYDKPELVKELTPAYCMPESPEHQVSWGLSQFTPRIIALNKNHAEMRS